MKRTFRSPAYFRTDMQISSGSEPFKTFGRITFDKRTPESK